MILGSISITEKYSCFASNRYPIQTGKTHLGKNVSSYLVEIAPMAYRVQKKKPTAIIATWQGQRLRKNV
jgi:hypothetical protein